MDNDEAFFRRCNQKSMDDRQIDTLIGISSGLIADGTINQAEATYLHDWLAQNRSLTDSPMIHNLYQHVQTFMEDGVLDDDEAEELFELLKKYSGGIPEGGEVAKATTLPLCDPAPPVLFDSQGFLFTGKCLLGSRAECQAAVQELGGKVEKRVTKRLNYLVIGTYVTESWKHEKYGRKIEEAVAYREAGIPIQIVSEKHWVEAASLANQPG